MYVRGKPGSLHLRGLPSDAMLLPQRPLGVANANGITSGRSVLVPGQLADDMPCPYSDHSTQLCSRVSALALLSHMTCVRGQRPGSGLRQSARGTPLLGVTVWGWAPNSSQTNGLPGVREQKLLSLHGSPRGTFFHPQADMA